MSALDDRWSFAAAEAAPRPRGAGLACVLDAGLSLSPTGLHWALALASVCPTWLTQTHWSVIEDPEFFLGDARLLDWTSVGRRPHEPEAFLETVRTWRDARDQLGFESRQDLFWHGFGRVGSVVPKDGDAGLIERVDALAAGFDSRRKSGAVGLNVIVDSARDTLALAAGLGARHTVILAPAERDAAAPAIVRELESVGVACARPKGTPLMRALAAPLVGALVSSGLATGVAAGGGPALAALAVVAPRANLARPRPEDDLDWQDQPSAEEAALWDHAVAVWWTPF